MSTNLQICSPELVLQLTIKDKRLATNQGIITCADLADLSDEELKAVLFDESKIVNLCWNANNQIVLPILAKAWLNAIRYEMELFVEFKSIGFFF